MPDAPKPPTRVRKIPKRPARLRAAADYADVHVITIRRWVANGTLSAYRRGPKLLFVDLDEIDRKLTRPIASTRDAR